MELIECERKGFIKKAMPSISLAKSLLEISETKEIAMNSAKIDETTVNAYLPMAYDSYAAYRMPYELAMQWFLYGLIQYIILGVVVAALHGKKSLPAAAA